MANYVVVGAAGGIGTSLVQQLQLEGHTVFACGRSEDKLNALGVQHTFVCDATDSAQVEAAFTEALSRMGTIDGAVNLCGSIILKPAHITTDKEFLETLAVNLHTAFYILRAATKAMTAGGAIVLVSTVATNIGLANHEAIAAAKGGINGLVLSAAATYASKNIRVNAVAPGLVKTPLASRITGNELALKASTAMHPLGRVGEPEDVASMITFLLNPKHAWITGQIIGVDGGLGSVRSK